MEKKDIEQIREIVEDARHSIVMGEYEKVENFLSLLDKYTAIFTDKTHE